MTIFPEHADISSLKNVKFGIDPTFNRLHIGHLVPLAWLMKNHRKDITIVLGVVTAQLGDPSGREKTRPILSGQVVSRNADTIKDFLKRTLPTVRVVYQDIWDVIPLLTLASNFTVAKMMSRDGFARRDGVATHELMVPLLQAMDSVALNTELEIGGEDQLFNFEVTREVQKIHGQKPEACLMFPVLRGTDGKKMSKSSGNCIWLDDPNIKQRVMAIPDEIMDEWIPLFCDASKAVPQHPKARKEMLAETICEILNPSKQDKT